MCMYSLSMEKMINYREVPTTGYGVEMAERTILNKVLCGIHNNITVVGAGSYLNKINLLV